MTTAIVCVQDNCLISEDTNYQGFVWDSEALVCTPTNSRVLKKWATLEPHFPALVKNKSFLDIGANMGFFCFKALEHGAQAVTGLEKHLPYFNSLASALRHLDPATRNLTWVHVKWPTEDRADVVMMLSMVHHLLARMSLEEILERLRQAAPVAIFEWVEPWDAMAKRKGYLDYPPRHMFLDYACENFGGFQCLGFGHHRSRFIYRLGE